MSPGVSPKHRHRQSGATEETRRGWRRCVNSEQKEISRYHLHGAMRSHYSIVLSVPPLAAPLLYAEVPNLPKTPKSPNIYSNCTNPATTFKNFSRQLKSLLYILLEPPQRLLYPRKFTLKQKFFYPPGMGKKSKLFPVSALVAYFPSSFCPSPSPLSPALLLRGESNKDI